MIELGRGVDECCDNGNLISIRIVLQELSFRHKKFKMYKLLLITMQKIHYLISS